MLIILPFPEKDRELEEFTAEKEIKNFVAWYVTPLNVTEVWPSLIRFALMEIP
jgi:hypothetical protein